MLVGALRKDEPRLEPELTLEALHGIGGIREVRTPLRQLTCFALPFPLAINTRRVPTQPRPTPPPEPIEWLLNATRTTHLYQYNR